MVPLALFHFQALGKGGRQGEEKRLSSLIARVDSLPGLCQEKELEGPHVPSSGARGPLGRQTHKMEMKQSNVGQGPVSVAVGEWDWGSGRDMGKKERKEMSPTPWHRKRPNEG